MDPLVSVVVTAYNHSEYIGQAISSVLAQTYAPFEVIVVDDGSTDDTPVQIACFNDRITSIRQSNRGVAASRNAGITAAQGEYIAFIDGDDLWEPEKLAVQVRAAQDHPGSGLIVVDGCVFDGEETVAPSLFTMPWRHELPEGGTTSSSRYRQLLKHNFIATTSQVMVPARVFDTTGLSDSAFACSSDYDLYLRIAARHDVTLTDRRLVRWRYLPTSASGPREERYLRYLFEDIAIIRKHLRRAGGVERSLLRQALRERILDGAEKCYSLGLTAGRLRGTSGLLKLMAGDPPSLAAAARLAGLWLPAPVRDAIRPFARNAAAYALSSFTRR